MRGGSKGSVRIKGKFRFFIPNWVLTGAGISGLSYIGVRINGGKKVRNSDDEMAFCFFYLLFIF